MRTPTLESCQLASEPNLAVFPLLDPEVERLTLAASVGSALELSYDGLGFTAEAPQLTAGSRYDLLAPGGIFPNEDVAAVLTMPTDTPAVSNPPISVTDNPDVSQYHTFQWTPGGADWVLIAMTVDDGGTEGRVESVVCAVQDDGEFDFDGSPFTIWSGERRATITVSFVHDQHEATLPWNRGGSAMAAMRTTVGAAYTY